MSSREEALISFSTASGVLGDFAVAIFGGFAPFIATWLIATTGRSLAAGWYVVAAVALSAALIAALHREVPVASPSLDQGRHRHDRSPEPISPGPDSQLAGP